MTTPEYEILAQSNRPHTQAEPRNLPVTSEADATGELATAYQYFRDQFGRPDLPGILKCFSSAPALLQQVMQLSEGLLFSDGKLGRRHEEMIATYTSALNACPYCADSHGFFLRIHGGEEATIDALTNVTIDGAPLNPADRALLRFVEKVNAESCKVEPADIQNLRNHNWTEDQIAEAIHLTGAFAFFNRVANAFGLVSQGLLDLKPEPPAVTLPHQESRTP